FFGRCGSIAAHCASLSQNPFNDVTLHFQPENHIQEHNQNDNRVQTLDRGPLLSRRPGTSCFECAPKPRRLATRFTSAIVSQISPTSVEWMRFAAALSESP
ncbi:MAG TPA: hypothetical protein VNR51_01400, partial [Hyphomicrobium sp.]|nr:hypothetical protein [Hyphomicrobium sp.]